MSSHKCVYSTLVSPAPYFFSGSVSKGRKRFQSPSALAFSYHRGSKSGKLTQAKTDPDKEQQVVPLLATVASLGVTRIGTAGPLALAYGFFKERLY